MFKCIEFNCSSVKTLKYRFVCISLIFDTCFFKNCSTGVNPWFVSFIRSEKLVTTGPSTKNQPINNRALKHFHIFLYASNSM